MTKKIPIVLKYFDKDKQQWIQGDVKTSAKAVLVEDGKNVDEALVDIKDRLYILENAEGGTTGGGTTNDFTNEYKNKLDNISDCANKTEIIDGKIFIDGDEVANLNDVDLSDIINSINEMKQMIDNIEAGVPSVASDSDIDEITKLN